MHHSISTIISCFARRRVLRKVLLKPANALVAANECLKSLGLKYLVQTPNVFVVASRTGSLSKSVHSSLLRQVCPRQSSEYIFFSAQADVLRR